MFSKKAFISLLLIVAVFCLSCSKQNISPLLLFETSDGEFGYMNYEGDTIIKEGKYSMCFTDTFKTFAIVLNDDKNIVAINQKEEILYKVFSYDNGPDYISEGLFRIIVDGKIGYADQKGNIVIKPKYNCAYPFQKGKARVSFNCTGSADGEHKKWEGEEWFYIDKRGNSFQ